jgi:acetate---CoA ligase (ADP-forming)
VRPIIDSVGAAKPFAVSLVPEAPEALMLLGAAGIPSFRTPEACADAIAAAFRRRLPKPIVLRRQATGSGRLLDEAEAGALIDRLGIPRAPAVALDADIARAPALPFSYPVAAKVLSAAIAHKTDVGGVALNVPDGEALLAVIARMREAIGIDRVLVQPMVSGIGEALVGYRVDPDVGPLVMVAAGGVHTEIYRDRSLRLAPVDLAEAHQMIGEVRMFRMLAGYRGKPAGDREALAQAIVALSQLARVDDPVVAEAEINPLIVQADGVVAVDALVKLM